MRKERHNLSVLTFPSTPPTTCGTQPQTTGLVSVNPESKPSFSEARTQLTDFFQISKSSAHASGAWRHSHPLVPITTWGFYFDISEWHILSTRAWTHALMLYLTNSCTMWKVLIITKPKGKIYKTKSLRHYFTRWHILWFCPRYTVFFPVVEIMIPRRLRWKRLNYNRNKMLAKLIEVFFNISAAK